MKWNIDADIQRLEKMLDCNDSPGTNIHRVLVDQKFLDAHKIKAPAVSENGSYFIWGIHLARMGLPRYFVSYGFTIKEAYLKAIKMLKATLNKKRVERRQKLGLKAPKKKEKKKLKKKVSANT